MVWLRGRQYMLYSDLNSGPNDRTEEDANDASLSHVQRTSSAALCDGARQGSRRSCTPAVHIQSAPQGEM